MSRKLKNNQGKKDSEANDMGYNGRKFHMKCSQMNNWLKKTHNCK